MYVCMYVCIYIYIYRRPPEAAVRVHRRPELPAPDDVPRPVSSNILTYNCYDIL